MNNISKKTCFPSTRKVLDFDLNCQHMRKTEVSEGNWVLGCSPDHSTIRPKILSLKSQPSPKDKSERLASRRKVVSSGFHSLVVLLFLLILSIVPIYFEHGCSNFNSRKTKKQLQHCYNLDQKSFKFPPITIVPIVPKKLLNQKSILQNKN